VRVACPNQINSGDYVSCVKNVF